MATAHKHVPMEAGGISRNLAFVAAAAAIELDNAARGQEPDWEAVDHLKTVLESRIPKHADIGPTTRSLLQLDPATADLFGRAFGIIGQRVDTVEDLRAIIQQMENRLSNVRREENQTSIAELRDFCVALSQIAQQEFLSRRASRPTSQFRR